LEGTSAWYAPGAAAAEMVEAIITDAKRIMPVCALVNGEYGLKGMYVGVPAILGKDGIDKIVEIEMNEEEQKMLEDSAAAVKTVMDVLDGMNLFA
jgi:malate dehydrogenase